MFKFIFSSIDLILDFTSWFVECDAPEKYVAVHTQQHNWKEANYLQIANHRINTACQHIWGTVCVCSAHVYEINCKLYFYCQCRAKLKSLCQNSPMQWDCNYRIKKYFSPLRPVCLWQCMFSRRSCSRQ